MKFLLKIFFSLIFTLWIPLQTGANFATSETIREQGFAGGGGLTWPEYKAAHPELPPHIALQRFKAIKRGQEPNANLGGGMHM